MVESGLWPCVRYSTFLVRGLRDTEYLRPCLNVVRAETERHRRGKLAGAACGEAMLIHFGELDSETRKEWTPVVDKQR